MSSTLKIYLLFLLVSLFPITSTLWSSMDDSTIMSQNGERVTPGSPIDRKAQRDQRRQEKSARKNKRSNRRALATYHLNDKPIPTDLSVIYF